jgi:DNA ligase (NAD+)
MTRPLDNIFTEIFDDSIEITKRRFNNILKKMENLYYNSDNPDDIYPDECYDKLVYVYEKKYGKRRRIGAKIPKDKVEIILPYYLGSMDKIYSKDTRQLVSWKQKYNGPYLLEDKLDGVSVMILYKTGETPKMYTRGDGYKSFDITSLLDYVNIPEWELQENDITDEFVFRGEIIISKENFKKFKDDYSNPRNLVSGVVNSKHFRRDVAENLDIVMYEIMNPKIYNAKDELINMENLGFIIPRYKEVDTIDMNILNDELEQFRENSVYEIDGIIIHDISDIYPVNQSGNPDNAFAFKNISKTNSAITTVKYVEWEISRYGTLKPIVHIKEVVIDGVKINKATGHNAKLIHDRGIGPEAVVEIIRGGEVIPKIQRVIKPSTPQMPSYVEWKWSGREIVIDETGQENEQQTINIINNFFTILRIKGISKKSIEKIVKYSVEYHTITSIIHITQDELIEIGFGKKQSENFINAIDKYTKNVELSLLMSATSLLGKGFGSKRLQKIIDVYYNDSLTDLLNLTSEQIGEINGWTKSSGKEFIKGFQRFYDWFSHNSDIITYTVSVNDSDGKFADQVFIFSGFRDKNLEQLVNNAGGVIRTNVSSKTTMVIVDSLSSTSGKITKAREIGIPIITKHDFEKNYLSNPIPSHP